MARYEVRVYNLEELLPENRMTYTPCDDREHAKRKYAESLQDYADAYHRVDLCEVTYSSYYGEAVKILASSENNDPNRIIWEEERI